MFYRNKQVLKKYIETSTLCAIMMTSLTIIIQKVMNHLLSIWVLLPVPQVPG